MVQVSRFTVRLCGAAVALGLGAAIATTPGAAWAKPSDTSSTDSSSSTPSTDGQAAADKPDKPTTPTDASSAKRPNRPRLFERPADKKPSQAAALPDVATNAFDTQQHSKQDAAKLPTLKPLAAILSHIGPKPPLSAPTTTLDAPKVQITTATESSQLTKPSAKLATATTTLAPKVAKPTDLKSVVTDFVSSVLKPFAATSDSPVPADSPLTWTMLAAAREELFKTPKPALKVTEAATLTVTTTAAPPLTLQSLLTTFLGPIVTPVFQVFDAAFAAAAGPPVLPAGSTVTVKSSTLEFENGYVAHADWYFPADENPQGIIYLQHGFLAQGPIYSYTAAALAEQTHSIVVAPTLTSNFLAVDGNWLGGSTMPAAAADLFVGDRAALVASASAAAGHPVTLPQKVVLVGHSLGGNFVLATAKDMAANGTIGDLAGLVLLDGVAFQPNLVEDTVTAVPSALPIYDISSVPYTWNLYGQMSTDLSAFRSGEFNGVQLKGGMHIDGLQGGNPLIQFAEYVVAGFSEPQNVEAYKTLAIGWINDMYAGKDENSPTHAGIYPALDTSVDIPTSAGVATAYAIPAPRGADADVNDFIQALFRFATGLFLGA